MSKFEENKKSGFIKSFRSFLEWEWYDDANTFRVFMHILLKAKYQDEEWRGITIKKGQYLTKVTTLAKELRLTVSQIRTSLKKLRLTNEITFETTNRNHLIEVVNWGDYQKKESRNDKQNDKQIANKSQTNRKQIANAILKEIKNSKEIKKVRETHTREKKNIYPKSVEEVIAFCKEENLSRDCSAFFNHNQSTGWKTKGGSEIIDWKARMRLDQFALPEERKITTPKNEPPKDGGLENTEFGRLLKPKLLEVFGKATYASWLSKLRFIRLDNQCGLVLSAPTEFIRDWILKEHFEGKANSKGIKQLCLEINPTIKSFKITVVKNEN